MTDFAHMWRTHTCTWRIIALVGEDLGSETILTPPLLCTCTKPGKEAVMYLCVRAIDFTSFWDISIWFWNCSDVVLFAFHFYYKQGNTFWFGMKSKQYNQYILFEIECLICQLISTTRHLYQIWADWVLTPLVPHKLGNKDQRGKASAEHQHHHHL
jgi:hypothetical protein